MLAMSGAGLLCLEATHVERDGRNTQGCLGLYSDENEAAIKSIVDWARAWMPTVKLGIQLAHAGRKASAQRPWKGGGPLTQADAPDLPWTTVSASAIPYDAKWHTPVALDTVGLKRVKQAFVDATLRSARLGFDVVELHGAHGYLLSQFLSPISNQRSDEYGGTADKRRRFPLEVFEACRKVWPAGKALGMRLSCVEWVEGGVSIEDTIETVRQLKALGCDFIDASSGGNAAAQKIPVKPGYHVAFANRIRKEAGIKTWAVGVITEPEQAEGIIAAGQADCTAHARAFLLDPRWGWNAARALGVETPPLPLPAVRATTILPFKPQPILARAAD
jgi:2,4-dienoyl-CoA reductase-like NADH-dependent reductase (Old Yellow Enzyme family)